jgi:hypothetical protein
VPNQKFKTTLWKLFEKYYQYFVKISNHTWVSQTGLKQCQKYFGTFLTGETKLMLFL